MRALTVLTSLALWAGLASAQAPEPLRLAVSSALAMPYAQFKDGQLVGGLEFELAQALAAQLGRPLRVIVLPQGRLDAAALAGEYDLRCHVRPDAVRAADYQWSEPLFALAEVGIGPADVAPPRSWDALAGVQPAPSVGTVIGYAYPRLDSAFAEGRLKRDDALSEERNLRKLQLKRNDVAIIDTRHLAWSQRQPAQALELAPWRLPLGSQPYHCAAPRQARIPAAELFAALQRVRGRMDQWVAEAAHAQPVIVVGAHSPVAALDRRQLTDLYLGRSQQLPDTSLAKLYVLRGAAHAEFASRVLAQDLVQWHSLWSRLSFGGRRRPPTEVADAKALRGHLLANPLALGYMDLSEVDETLRVVFVP